MTLRIFIIKRGTIARDDFISRFTNINHGNEKEKYFDPIKKQPSKIFDESSKVKKKVPTIPEDEGQSFSDILSRCNDKVLDLKFIMKWPVTSRTWAICSEECKTRN